jgi:hypothetical protein
MIADRCEFRGFDAERVANLIDLAAPPGAARGSAIVAGPPGLAVLREGNRVRKAVHTVRGRLDPDQVRLGGSHDLGSLARAHGAKWVAVADAEALVAAHERASAALRPGCDLVDVGLEVGRAYVAELERGGVALWPDLLEGVTIPRRGNVEKALDVVLPPRTASVFYVFDGSRLHGELICARGDRQIEVFAGHDALGVGAPPARWKDEHKRLLEAVERRFAKPSVGIFVSLDTARAAARGQITSSEVPRLARRKDLIIDPLPPWLAAPLGLVAVKGAVEVGRKAGERIAKRVDPTGLGGMLAGKVGGALKNRLKRTAVAGKVEETLGTISAKADLSEHLGFDPFVVSARFLALWRED